MVTGDKSVIFCGRGINFDRDEMAASLLKRAPEGAYF